MAGQSKYARRLPLWVLIGGSLGILTGLFFGNDAAVLRPIGATYVKLMEFVVFPYIVCSLLHGLGRLSPDTAWRLFRSSWLIFLAVWGLAFLVIFLMSLAIPPVPPPSFVDGRVVQESLGLLDLVIPVNPILDLARNHLPAVVVFSIVYGVAIQRVKDKEAFLSFLDLIRSASVTIWGWVVLLAPFGVFALFADTAGTLEPAALADLSLYLIATVVGTLILAFWVLPSVMAALCPLTTREVLRDLQNAVIISVVTSLSVAALPFIQQAAEKMAKEADIQDENCGEIIKTTLAVSYPLAQLGNFFVWLFVLFAAFYYRIPISIGDQLALPFVVLLSGFGSPTSSVGAVSFLSEWLKFPDDATELYVGMMTITRYGQVLASVMGFAFVCFLVTLNYYGRLTLKMPRLGISLGTSVAFLLFLTLAGQSVQSRFVDRSVPYLGLKLDRNLTEGVETEIELEGGSATEPDADALSSEQGILDRIQSTGELKVGYNPNIIPFSYRNTEGNLVGFDIAYAYQLARDLNVRLRLIPFTWDGLDQDLMDRRFDLAVSGIYVTDGRLRRFAISEPYYQSPIALIVRSDAVDKFLKRSDIEANRNLTFAVFDDPIMTELAARLFPGYDVRVVPNYSDLPKHPEIDAAIWTLAQAKAWATPRPDYTAVIPRNLGGQFLIAYLMPKGAQQFREFLDYWFRLQRVNGFHDRMGRVWIEGKTDPKETPRWSVIRDVFGWKSQ